MFPSDVIADLRWGMTIMTGLFAAMGAVIWYLLWLLDRGCPSCSHCQNKKRTNVDSTRERLFGRQVETAVVEEPSDVAPDEGASDHPDGSSSQSVPQRIQAWLFLRLLPEDMVVIGDSVGDNRRDERETWPSGQSVRQADSRVEADSPTTTD